MNHRKLMAWFWLLAGGLGGMCCLSKEGYGQPSMGNERPIIKVMRESPVREDYVLFTNGDILTGKIAGVVAGAVEMRPEMTKESLRIPVDAIKHVVFKDRQEKRSFQRDWLLLTNGESLQGAITGFKEGKCSLELSDSQAAQVNGEDMAAVAFHRKERILLEEDFDSGLPEGVAFEGGSWRTQRGWLLQGESGEKQCSASFAVTQAGELSYEWTVNTSASPSTGIYIMAGGAGLPQQEAYFVRVLRKFVYIYLCRKGEEIYCGSYPITLYKNRNEVRLTCDSERGMIELEIDGMHVGRWVAGTPIGIGKYVVLRCDGRAAFGKLRIIQEEGTARPAQGIAPVEEDMVMLVNGDTFTGKIKEISEEAVSFAGPGVDTVISLEREQISYIRLKSTPKSLPRGMNGRTVLVTYGGDRISGELEGLDGDAAKLSASAAGTLGLPRNDIRKVIFREFP